MSSEEGLGRDHDYWHRRAVRATHPSGALMIKWASLVGASHLASGELAVAEQIGQQIDRCLLVDRRGTGQFGLLMKVCKIAPPLRSGFEDTIMDEHSLLIERIRYR